MRFENFSPRLEVRTKSAFQRNIETSAQNFFNRPLFLFTVAVSSQLLLLYLTFYDSMYALLLQPKYTRRKLVEKWLTANGSMNQCY